MVEVKRNRAVCLWKLGSDLTTHGCFVGLNCCDGWGVRRLLFSVEGVSQNSCWRFTRAVPDPTPYYTEMPGKLENIAAVVQKEHRAIRI